MKNVPPQPVYAEDYRPLPFHVEEVALTFDLDADKTVVTAKAHYRSDGDEPLILHGADLTLRSIALNGETPAYTIDGETLTIPSVPQTFLLEVVTEVSPRANTALEGLYLSGDILCTQNEPEGFRHITYFLDRPDIMTRYTTTLIADKERYPVLLSNGNPIDSGNSPDGKHWVCWQDPFPKPSYLFAVVAGNLGMISDTFTTMSGRTIDLRIYCDPGEEGKCHHAMRSLKKAMKWDEEVYGLEYDLDIFMIVAVDSFNFGAMENKGLNIFNSSCALADEHSATDDNFVRVEGVIAHEYFHNWTGNRVTCRDWFQLTLKEGLTVFRDQEFTADMHSRPVKRIEDVEVLRRAQFTEDSGPTAHPIKPKHYLQINNFYTATVYNKGAEVIRMIHTLLGHTTFCKGIATYFSLFDGQAVTTEDFIHAMEVASGRDLTNFSRWYHQAGTPTITASYDYDAAAQRFTLTLEQKDAPLVCPIAFGLLGSDGSALMETQLLLLEEKRQLFTFDQITEPPIPSLNRGFSAPVIVEAPYSTDDLAFLMAHDSDPFNRWDAGQELAMRMILDQLNEAEFIPNKRYFEAFSALLADDIDPAFRAIAITLPSETIIAQKMEVIDFAAIHRAREGALTALSNHFYDTFLALYHSNCSSGDYTLDAKAIGQRALKNRCLAYLLQSGRQEAFELASKQFESATNMTDEIAALSAIVNNGSPDSSRCLAAFFDKWKDDHLVVCKWLAAQAASKQPGALERVRALIDHPIYDDKVPNLVRALLGAFMQNHAQLHQPAGYAFIGEQIAHMDSINPHIAAILAGTFKKLAKVDSQRQQLMRSEIEKLLAIETLSTNTYEILSKCLQQ